MTTVLRTDDGFNGKMVNHTLLPKNGNRVIDKVGGPGKEPLPDGEANPFATGQELLARSYASTATAMLAQGRDVDARRVIAAADRLGIQLPGDASLRAALGRRVGDARADNEINTRILVKTLQGTREERGE